MGIAEGESGESKMLKQTRRVIAVAVVALAMLVASRSHIIADEFDLLWMEFDAAGMSEAEKRYLQTGLALEGEYLGLLDGAWGRGSQSALERFVARRFPDLIDQKPLFFHAFFVFLTVAQNIEEAGWDDRHFPSSALSLAAPWGLLRAIERTENAWSTEADDLEVRYFETPIWEAVADHNKVMGYHTVATPPYLVRREDRMVTSVQFIDGGGAYFRSDRVANRWVSVLIVAEEPQHNMLGAIASGVHFGPPRDWSVPERSLLRRVVDLGVRAFEESQKDESAIAANQPAARSQKRQSADNTAGSGTGFYVNNTDVVTAEHVVHGCTSVTLEDGTLLSLIDADSEIDLAVLSSPNRSRDWLPISNSRSAVLGERAYVLGYPYYRFVGTSLNFTTGNVSALAGVGDDHRFISLSAPVQPGNSGGPLLNSRGEILGVISSRLSERVIADATGSLPQNINFAVTAHELVRFLDRANVLFPVGQAISFDLQDGAPDPIQRAVVPILCWE